MTTAHEYAAAHRDEFINQLTELLRIKSIGTDSAYNAEVLRAAEWLAEDMSRMGLENIQLLPTGGHPVVYGDWLHAGEDAPTVLVYGHYDVQPADMKDGWSHPPFEPRTENGKLYARGATDDKGQVMIQLKAMESLLATGGSPVNVKYMIEGEEESGSTNLENFVKNNRDLLQADVCLISDTGMRGMDKPTIYYSVRGLIATELIVKTTTIDLHSGQYGGIVHNPAQAVAEIVAKLHNDDGSVAVPGFYDSVRELSAEDREKMAEVDALPSRITELLNGLPEWGEPGYNRAERTGARPTLEINGISGGYTGDGFKTVIPARAIAKISCRLVADQDPHEIYELIKRYIAEITPETVRTEFRLTDAAYAAITPLESPYMKAAERAIAYHWDEPVIFERGGGSLPVVAMLQQEIDLPVILLGFALPDAQAHGPDENLTLEMFYRGVDCVIEYMNDVANIES